MASSGDVAACLPAWVAIGSDDEVARIMLSKFTATVNMIRLSFLNVHIDFSMSMCPINVLEQM